MIEEIDMAENEEWRADSCETLRGRRKYRTMDSIWAILLKTNPIYVNCRFILVKLKLLWIRFW